MAAVAAAMIPHVEAHDDTPAEGWVYWEEGDLLLRRTAGGVLVGVAPFLFTWGVIRHVDAFGYRERWCFPSLDAAMAAASVLGDDDEPVGAIRKVGRA